MKNILPHFEERKLPISMIVLHCSTEDTNDMIRTLDKLSLSCHYIIGYDGKITQIIDEKYRAWHAGISFWNGIEDINSASIGIEISNKTLGQSPYQQNQIDSLISLLENIIKKYNISPKNIVAHSDVAPNRKPDPGISFPWQTLAKKNIGIWYDINDANKEIEDNEDNIGTLLQKIGYDTRTKEKIIASSYAFCRRFLPNKIAVENDINFLVDNIYPIGNASILADNEFIKTLKAVAYIYSER